MANMLAERIKSVALTKKQKQIAEYFIQNQDRLGNLSSIEAAKEIGVSDASIIRFSRAIGFDGFADLKKQIYDMLVENASPGLSLSERLALNEEKNRGGNTAVQFQQLMQQNIASVFQDNKPEDFEKAADMLVHANTRYVIGMRGCKGIAAQFGRLLSFMMEGVTTLLDGECVSISALQDLKEGDAVIMFVYSRFYKIDQSYLEMARKRGAKICLVLNDITGPLGKYADIVLMVNVSYMSFFYSTIGADMIGEYILTLISRKVEYKERIKERDMITAVQRI